MQIMFNVEIKGVPVSVGDTLYCVEFGELKEVSVDEISVLVTKDNTFCNICVVYETEIGECSSSIHPDEIIIETRYEDVDDTSKITCDYYTDKSVAQKVLEFRRSKYNG